MLWYPKRHHNVTMTSHDDVIALVLSNHAAWPVSGDCALVYVHFLASLCQLRSDVLCVCNDGGVCVFYSLETPPDSQRDVLFYWWKLWSGWILGWRWIPRHCPPVWLRPGLYITSFPVFNKRVVILAPIPQLFWLDSISLAPALPALAPLAQIYG